MQFLCDSLFACNEVLFSKEKAVQVSSRFTMALHMFACTIAFEGTGQKMTSDFMAQSIGTNPVVVRKLLQKLKAAGLLTVVRGTGGVKIARPLDEISFLDVYRAVESPTNENLFHFHENPNPSCPVGRTIHAMLDEKLTQVQSAMERTLDKLTLSDLHVQQTQQNENSSM